MSDVLAQVLIQTAQWSWVRNSESKTAFEIIGGNCYLPNKDHILRALKQEMLLELMAIHQLAILDASELKTVLKLVCPVLTNQTHESIELEVNNGTMRSFIFWLTLNNCLHQIISKFDSKDVIEFMGQTYDLSFNQAEIDQMSTLNAKVSEVINSIFDQMPNVNELKVRWHKDFAKNSQNNLDIVSAVAILGFMLYSFAVGFQYHQHPFISAFVCAGMLFSTSCLIRFCLRIRELSFNEIYCKMFIKNFSQKVRSRTFYSNF